MATASLQTAPERRLASFGSLSVSLLAGLALVYLFAPAIGGLVSSWAQPEFSHGWLIPLVTLLCLWQRRERILAERSHASWAGPAIVGVGLSILILASMTLMLVPQALALLVVLAGLGVVAVGWRGMRLAWMPLAFLLFALPLPGTAYLVLSTQLQHLSSEIGAWMLQTGGVSVFLDGNVIDLGSFKLQVAEACSGLRYLFPLSAFGFLCAWLYRAPLWAKVLVFLTTIPITTLTNSARIALTGVLMEFGNRELAEGFLHLFEGWLIFLVALICLFLFMWILAKLRDPSMRLIDMIDFDQIAGKSAHDCRPEKNARAHQQISTLIRLSSPFLTCVILFGLAIPVQAWLLDRGVHEPDRPGLVTFPLHLGDWEGRLGTIDGEILDILKADDYLLADFTEQGRTGPVNLWVAYYGSRIEQNQIHTPKVCLPGAGWEFTQIDVVPAPAPDPSGQTFDINRALLSNGPQQLMMYYWFEQRGRHYTNEMWTKISLLRDAFTTGRSDGALIRLITPVSPTEPESDAISRLDDFFRAMYPALQPHVGA